jgi:hypothetical protein
VTRLRRWIVRLRPSTPESWIGLGVVTACVLFVAYHVRIDLVLAKTTPAGGDMGAHVWGPAYLRDHLLPSFRLTGWTPDWYAGFPAFQFYMLPPALIIVLLDIVLPYGIAMKLVTVSGVLALPICAYAMGRLARMPFPAPPLLAVATVPFLFDRGWTIYGGNIPSTLAGEYSFSISLSLALLFFGVLARGLETGRHRALATVLLALSILCHAIPAFFAVVGAVLLVALRASVARALFAAPVVVLGCLLTAFWSVPFFLRRELLTDMGWERLGPANGFFDLLSNPTRITDYGEWLVPGDTRWVFVLAMVGTVLSVVFRIRFGIFLTAMAVVFAGAFVFDAAAVVNIWNARLLPFYYLCLYLLAAIGVAEVLRSIGELVSPATRSVRGMVEVGGSAVALAGALVLVALPLRTLPFGTTDADGTYRWGFLETKDDSFVDSWVAWNFNGYERKPAYAEYHGIVSTMKQLGETSGCGRAHWEYQKELDRYGTPMALMLLPFWTDGCIASMEGLYFESSGTTPFHFLNAAEVSAAPSNPVRDEPDRPMPYRSFDLERGIEHLELMGVRYYMAFSTQAVTAAASHPDLREVASSPPWTVYEIEGSSVVEPLRYEPAVVEDLSDSNPAWQKAAVEWYMQPEDLDVPLASSGPDEWQRIRLREEPERREVEPVQVSDVDVGRQTISFDVDEPGRPVLVKTSYFPNWKVSGAQGPYRVTPNLMVVVPTDEHVEMRFGYTWVELVGWGLTLLAVAGVVWLARRGRVTFPDPPVRDRDLLEELYRSPPSPPPEPVLVGAPGGAWQDSVPSGAWEGSSRGAGPDSAPEAHESDERAGDPPDDGRTRRAPLLDPDGELGDTQARPFGP